MNTIDSAAEVNYITITLDKIKVGLDGIISEYLSDGYSEVRWNSLHRQVEYKIRGYVWGEELEDRQIKYPRDWWQAFKARWFPKWLLKKYPTIYTVHKITANVLYPDLKVKVQQYRHVIAFNESSWWDNEPQP